MEDVFVDVGFVIMDKNKFQKSTQINKPIMVCGFQRHSLNKEEKFKKNVFSQPHDEQKMHHGQAANTSPNAQAPSAHFFSVLSTIAVLAESFVGPRFVLRKNTLSILVGEALCGSNKFDVNKTLTYFIVLPSRG